MKTYRFPNGSKLVIPPNRQPVVMPRWCNHIPTPIDRADAAAALRKLRVDNERQRVRQIGLAMGIRP